MCPRVCELYAAGHVVVMVVLHEMRSPATILDLQEPEAARTDVRWAVLLVVLTRCRKCLACLQTARQQSALWGPNP